MAELTRDQRIDLLKDLSQVPGIPGHEVLVAKAMERHLSGLVTTDYDALGSVAFERTADDCQGPRVMLAGHMDEIGFIVKRVTDEGFIKFHQVGGWWDQILLGHRVVIKTRSEDVIGVIGSKPPHILTSEDRKKLVKTKDMFIDIGAKNKEEVEDFGIRIGDPILPVSPFTQMTNPDRLMSKAWDDRVGCGLMVDLFHRLEGESVPNHLIAVGTVQEEVGLRGAQTSAALVEPDVAIALEVSIAGDVPGGNPDEASDKLGDGPSLLLFDRSMIPNLKFRDLVMTLAREHNIPLQPSVMARGGTDAGKIHMHRTGVPSIVLAVPTRYIHAQSGIISLADYEKALDLLTVLVRALDAETVASFRP